MKRHLAGVAAAALFGLFAASSANALVINDYFDSSITSASNASDIESAIEAVTNQYSALYDNPVSVNIYFQTQPADAFLGMTQLNSTWFTYNDYTSAAMANALANPDNKPLAEGLNSALNGPSNTADYIFSTSAGMRANGLSAPANLPVPGQSVGFDGIVTLTSALPLDYGTNVPAYDGSNYEFSGRNIIAHEVDEVLGIGGAGSILPDTSSTFEGTLDRFRYSAPGAPSFSTDQSATAYYSLDNGATNLATFNQIPGADFGDLGPTTYACSAGGFGGPPGQIQDAISCNNVPAVGLTRGSIEDTMLQSIGWDPTLGSVPEPATWALLMAGIGLMGAALRRRPAPLQARA